MASSTKTSFSGRAKRGTCAIIGLETKKHTKTSQSIGSGVWMKMTPTSRIIIPNIILLFIIEEYAHYTYETTYLIILLLCIQSHQYCEGVLFPAGTQSSLAPDKKQNPITDDIITHIIVIFTSYIR